MDYEFYNTKIHFCIHNIKNEKGELYCVHLGKGAAINHSHMHAQSQLLKCLSPPAYHVNDSSIESPQLLLL